VNIEAARAAERVDSLIELGIDSPLKLDVLTSIEQQGGSVGGPEALAAACGVSQRELVPTLEELVRSGLLERRRFYNVTDYSSTTSDDLRARLRELVAEGPSEIRRLRRALLARASRLG
jgi:hypothetical protein